MDIESRFDSMMNKVNNFLENITFTKPVAITAAIAFVLIIAGLIVWRIVSYKLRERREENERGYVYYREFLYLLDSDNSWRRVIILTMGIALVSVLQTVPVLSKIWEYIVFSFISLVYIAVVVLRCFIFKDYFLIKKIRKRAHGNKIRIKDGVIVTVDEWLEKEGLKIGG